MGESEAQSEGGTWQAAGAEAERGDDWKKQHRLMTSLIFACSFSHFASDVIK